MSDYPGFALHRVAPYIGRVRPRLARQLVMHYTGKGDWVWDPFCGSGTVPLECRLLDRHVFAADTNPYACALTRAKLHAPISKYTSLTHLELAATEAKQMRNIDLRRVPKWVRCFFHNQTLKETLALMKVFLKREQYFIIGCLLGILHHQRPGFLSYPASHLVPYLRNRLYPRNLYPEAYEYRDPIPRLEAKINRLLEFPPSSLRSRFRVLMKSAFMRYLPNSSIDAVITSPPYMDALDYARDNRLRLWFLGVTDYRTIKDKEIRKIGTFNEDMSVSLQIMSEVVKPGGFCVFIVGDITRDKNKYEVPEMICGIVKTKIKQLSLQEKWVESVPDRHRTRKNCKATKKEAILVFRRI